MNEITSNASPVDASQNEQPLTYMQVLIDNITTNGLGIPGSEERKKRMFRARYGYENYLTLGLALKKMDLHCIADYMVAERDLPTLAGKKEELLQGVAFNDFRYRLHGDSHKDALVWLLRDVNREVREFEEMEEIAYDNGFLFHLAFDNLEEVVMAANAHRSSKYT